MIHDPVAEYAPLWTHLDIDQERVRARVYGLAPGHADAVLDAVREFFLLVDEQPDRARRALSCFGVLDGGLAPYLLTLQSGGAPAREAFDHVLHHLRQSPDRDALAAELFGASAERAGDSLYAFTLAEG